jgi:two-component system chemotaxis sensor kinase CheA
MEKSDDNHENEFRSIFLEEAQELLEAAEAGFMSLDGGDHSTELINHLFRVAHSFKGSAASVGFTQLSRFAHRIEDVLAGIKNGDLTPEKNVCSVLLSALDVLRQFVQGLKSDPDTVVDSLAVEKSLETCLKSPKNQSTSEAAFGIFDDEDQPPSRASQPQNQPPRPATPPSRAPGGTSTDSDFIRVSNAKIDSLLNIVGEIVVNQSMLMEHRFKDSLNSPHAYSTLDYMTRVIKEIQDVSLSLRMLPAKPLFQKMKRAVRDVAVLLKKEIDFVCLGEDLDLDKVLLERMTDPLTHLVRNAVDHGIEASSDRVKASKPTTAKIVMSIVQVDDRVIISVVDDGKGLDRAFLVKKAIEKGLIDPKDQLSDDEAHKLIFRPGFSTKDQVSEISGRGVGLDVVQQAIEGLKGSLEVKTNLGKGTTFLISLPLSFSIIEGMVVSVADQKYIVPMPQLIETLQFHPQKIQTSVGKGRMMSLRGEAIPILSLHEILHGTPSDPVPSRGYQTGLVSLVQGRKISFEVDEIIGKQQIVLKKLGKEMQGVPGITAGAILANGDPGIVISLNELAMRRSYHVP